MDCDPNHEVYMIKADSVFAPTNNNFVAYFGVPLRNVVKVELLAASIHSNVASSGGSNYVYVYVDELASKFNDRCNGQLVVQVSGSTSNIGPNQSGVIANVSKLAKSIVGIVLEEAVTGKHRTNFSAGNDYTAPALFIEPIRRLDRLSIELLNASGSSLLNAGNTFLTFKFTCAKQNTCQY
jgi:hypothetical protein